MQTIKFKPEYEKELLRLGVKTRFLKNRIEFCKSVCGDITDINAQLDFRYFVMAAFIWAGAPEHHKFWENVSNGIKPKEL